MPKDMQDKPLGYIIYIKQKDISNGKGQEITGNRKGTRSNESRRSSRLYSSFHPSIQ